MPAVTRTNPDKVLWPDAGVTKGELFDHYDRWGEPLLEALRGRPLTVVRAPNGIDEQTFFQKNAPRGTPDWVRTVTTPVYGGKREVSFIVCDDADTLSWLGQQAAVELHVTTVLVDTRADVLVWDMDPPEGDGAFAQAVAAARAIRAALAEHGLEPAVKTTGGKGLHIVLAVQPTRHGDAVVQAVADRAMELEPDLFTTEFKKADRDGRVLMDTGRNHVGATFVAPFSPRARAGATVSFPVSWDDLDDIDPKTFTIRTAADLVDSRDVKAWRKHMRERNKLPKALTVG